jgi:GT2 family glycosyltransferase
MVEWVVRLRSKWLGLIFGDQGIFARREAFKKVGGFKGLPLMEDVDFIRRLKSEGKVVCLDEGVVVSARRWEEAGAFWNGLKNWLVVLFYFLGVSPARLYNWYYQRSN